MPALEANALHEPPELAMRYLLQFFAMPLWVGPGAPDAVLVVAAEDVEDAAVGATYPGPSTQYR